MLPVNSPITETLLFNNNKKEFLEQNTSPIAFVKESEWKAGDILIQKELANTLKRIRDNGQDGLLTKKNRKKKQGDLVIEAVCANNTTLAKVGTTCKGYVNHIQLPKVGDHVKVTGSLVIDTHNGWAEIHPITKIELIK